MSYKKKKVIRRSLFCWHCPANPLKKLRLESHFGSLARTPVCAKAYVIIADSNISSKLLNAMWQDENQSCKFSKNTRTYIFGGMWVFTINYSKIRKKRKRWQRNCLFYLSENFKLPPSIVFKLVCTCVQGFRQLWGARVTQLTAFVFCIRLSIHVWLLAQLLSLYSEDEFGD